MELEQVKDSTWVLKSWELIPVYRLDAHKCILLDTGLVEQREELQEALTNYGLEPVGVICSHAHIDHMGNVAYLKEKYGAKLAMSLGEAGHQMSYLGLNVTSYLLPPEDLESWDAVKGTPCLADRIILPTEDHITFCGAEFDIVHTPGHTVDHICTRTADNVLYLGDAMMTGRTLHHSKFPFAFCVRDYLDSMRKMRSEPADKFIVAHFGVYDEILPLVDMEARFFAERMLDHGPQKADVGHLPDLSYYGDEALGCLLLRVVQPVLPELSPGLGLSGSLCGGQQHPLPPHPHLVCPQRGQTGERAAQDRAVPMNFIHTETKIPLLAPSRGIFVGKFRGLDRRPSPAATGRRPGPRPGRRRRQTAWQRRNSRRG